MQHDPYSLPRARCGAATLFLFFAAWTLGCGAVDARSDGSISCGEGLDGKGALSGMYRTLDVGTGCYVGEYIPPGIPVQVELVNTETCAANVAAAWVTPTDVKSSRFDLDCQDATVRCTNQEAPILLDTPVTCEDVEQMCRAAKPGATNRVRVLQVRVKQVGSLVRLDGRAGRCTLAPQP